MSLFPNEIDFKGAFPRLSRRLRLGVVGGGRISQMQASAARLSDYWEVAAGAFSSDPEKARAAGKAWFLPDERCYPSFQEMAQREAQRPDGVDAVMITTPNHLHALAAKAFLEAGIHVLCDKPLTNETSEAQELAALVEQTGQVFGVSYVDVLLSDDPAGRELVQQGALGHINQIHVEFMQDWMIPEMPLMPRM